MGCLKCQKLGSFRDLESILALDTDLMFTPLIQMIYRHYCVAG